MHRGPIKLLLIEDDEEDIFLMKDAFRSSTLSIDLDVVHNGDHAMAYLQQAAPYAQMSRPHLVLLDLNLPRKNGWEVLEGIKTDSRLKALPVTILTTSSQNRDIRLAYEKGANCYITKPIGLEPFSTVVNSIENFWCSIVELPLGG